MADMRIWNRMEKNAKCMRWQVLYDTTGKTEIRSTVQIFIGHRWKSKVYSLNTHKTTPWRSESIRFRTNAYLSVLVSMNTNDAGSFDKNQVNAIRLVRCRAASVPQVGGKHVLYYSLVHIWRFTSGVPLFTTTSNDAFLFFFHELTTSSIFSSFV